MPVGYVAQWVGQLAELPKRPDLSRLIFERKRWDGRIGPKQRGLNLRRQSPDTSNRPKSGRLVVSEALRMNDFRTADD
jgi:hypothetical protein